MSGGYHIVIPARMASQRLPGKPLADLAGKPLIRRVHERAMESTADSVVIATDSREILDAANSFGAVAVMTARRHQSGSDRIAECADLLGWPDEAVIVNLQGDEPQMPARCLDQVAGLLKRMPGADVASLCRPIEDAREVADPNVVKVVMSEDGLALYFSRSAIPYARDFTTTDEALAKGTAWYRHVGVYAYRAGALRAFTSMAPTPLELTERLEQLRFLESGQRIAMAPACEPIPPGVDTPGDLQRVREYFDRRR